MHTILVIVAWVHLKFRGSGVMNWVSVLVSPSATGERVEMSSLVLLVKPYVGRKKVKALEQAMLEDVLRGIVLSGFWMAGMLAEVLITPGMCLAMTWISKIAVKTRGI